MLCVCWRADFAATETGQCLPSSSKDDGRNDSASDNAYQL
jgi:hypothetical protein